MKGSNPIPLCMHPHPSHNCWSARGAAAVELLVIAQSSSLPKPTALQCMPHAVWHRDISALLKISSGGVSIALPAYFRSLALYLISAEFSTRQLHLPPCSSSGEPESEAWMAGQAMSQDFVAPLAPDELDRCTLCVSHLHMPTWLMLCGCWGRFPWPLPVTLAMRVKALIPLILLQLHSQADQGLKLSRHFFPCHMGRTVCYLQLPAACPCDVHHAGFLQVCGPEL